METNQSEYLILIECCGSYGLSVSDSIFHNYYILFNSAVSYYIRKRGIKGMSYEEIDRLVMEIILRRCCG